MRFGAYYYDTWYKKTPQWTNRLLTEFAGREPVWGWKSDTVESMETQINYASDGGLSFWAFDWYYPQKSAQEFIPAKSVMAELEQNGFVKSKNGEDSYFREPNYALERFFKSKNCNKLDFCLLVANHDGHHGSWMISNDNWKDACEYFLRFMSMPNALKVDNKPLIIIFSPLNLIRSMGGEENVKQGIKYLHKLCEKRGLGGCVVAASHDIARDIKGNVSEDDAFWLKYLKQIESSGFDAVTGYNYHRITPENDSLSYPYERLCRDYEKVWQTKVRLLNVPYMPAVNGGWDCRPWETKWEGYEFDPYMDYSCYSDDKSPEVFEKHVENAKKFVERNKDKCLSDLAVCYAWNELGEGGYIAPTKESGNAYLEAVKKALNKN